MGYLKTFVQGNVVQDAQLYSGDKQRVTFTVAANLYAGNGKERAEFVRCCLWGKRAPSIAPHLKKGRSVFVAGEPAAYAYTAEDGGLRACIELRVDDVVLTGAKPAEAAPAEPEPAPVPEEAPTELTPVEDDGLPF